MRECNGCSYCCDGHLSGEVDGKSFGQMEACHNLTEDGCNIYDNRPNMCHNYYCAWAQELFPEWMKPNECGVVISVETEVAPRGRIGKQYLKAVYQKELPLNVAEQIQQFVDENDTYFVPVKVIPIKSIK